jgi:hypothetical protein
MFEALSNPILQNPLFIGAVLALLRNIGGYLYNCFEAKKLLPYDASQLLLTMGLWETVFTIAMGSGYVDAQTTTILTLVLDWIRGLKTAISNNGTPAPAAAPQKPAA